jgi:hypothetical protein
MTDKQTLQAQITQLKNVLASPKTDGSTRKILETALRKAEAKMDDLAKAQKLENSNKKLTPKQKSQIKETKKETKSLAESLKEKVKKAKQKVVTTTPKATTKKGGSRSVAKAKQIAKEMRSKQARQSTKDSDIESDARRFAINKTKRTSHGGRANQYGTKAENKGGTYYESRENRFDRQNKRYAKLEDGGMMASGGEISNFESKIKNALKEENKWHFISENVNGKDVQIKMFVGKKEVDVQRFMVDGLHARMPRNYAGKRDTLKMIMENIDSKYADGGLLGYASGGSATSSVGGTTFSDGDLSGIFAKGGITEHGLMVGDMIVRTTNEPYSIVVRNNGQEAIVDLNEGTREVTSMGMAHGGQTRFQTSSDSKYADGGLLGYASGGSATSSVGGTTFSDGDLSGISDIDLSGGMFAKGGMVDVKKIREEYEENEDNNLHSENVVLLAKHFGSESDLRNARIILSKHEAIGHLPSYLSQERDELSRKLYKKMVEASTKMAKGGEIEVKEGDMIKSKTIKGRVYESMGTMFKIEDEYGNKNPKYYNTRDFKKSEITKMANGGETNGMEVVNYLKGVSGLRASYIAEWADKNNVDLNQVQKAIKTKKLKPIDFSTALSGKEGNKYAKDIISKYSQNKMAKGGMTKPKFMDKVKSISKSLLKKKKVSPKVQKDYGKTYDKKEAMESAKRIAGSMRKKEMSKKKS